MTTRPYPRIVESERPQTTRIIMAIALALVVMALVLILLFLFVLYGGGHP